MNIWEPIPTYPGYMASRFGEICSVERIVHTKSGPRRLKGKLLSLIKLNEDSDYLVVDLGRGNRKLVHALVLEAFERPPLPGEECRHLNGNASDNRLENLQWGTAKENMADRTAHGNNPNLNKTQCPRGHLLTSDNVQQNALDNGFRRCKACHRAAAYCARHSDLDFAQTAEIYYQGKKPY